MNIEQAKQLKQGQIVYHKIKTNADGSPMRAKVTSVKTWKRSPEKIEIGLKRGLYDYAKFTENELHLLSYSENWLKESDFTRINNDINGNPRYVIYFFKCEPKKWKNDSIELRYANVCKLMNKIGGRKFHNKQYGGGIVFQSYSLPELIEDIERLKGELK